jgi:hypothetical protein
MDDDDELLLLLLFFLMPMRDLNHLVVAPMKDLDSSPH